MSEEEIPELEPKREKKEKRMPKASIPVRAGGSGFVQIRYWEGDPDAEKRFRRSSAIELVQKKKENGEWKDGDNFYLSPSLAIAVAPVLERIGLRGKEHDLKQNG